MLLGLLLATVLPGCGPRPESAPLTFEGSPTLARYLLPDLIPGYQRASGHRFGAIQEHGSTAGFRAATEGRAALGGMSRTLRSAERVTEPYYAIIGYDALGVFVHPDNPVERLSREQLEDVFSGKVTNWKQLGGADAPIELLFDPAGAQASEELFQEEVLEGRPYGPGRPCKAASGCAEEVSRTPNAITFSSMARLVPGVKVLEVDGLLPTARLVRSGEYLLSRPIMIVTKGAPRGQARAFLDYALSPEGQAQVARHFVPVEEVR